MRIILTLVLLSYAALGVAASEQVCRNGALVRTIGVEYEQKGEKVPCKVRYDKETGLQYPWYANYTEGFCEEKAAYLASKLENWGWKCKKQRVKKRRSKKGK